MNYNGIVSVIFGLLLLVPAGSQLAFAGSCGPVGSPCDDGNPCTSETRCSIFGTCILELGTSNLLTGNACGEGPTECSGQDTCLAGVCSNPNHFPLGFACGDQNDSNPCAGACNNFGVCDPELASSGNACGDQTATACSAPDVCILGVCNTNNHGPEKMCDDGDGNVCTGVCDVFSGTCIPVGVHPFHTDVACGDQSSSACSNPNVCTTFLGVPTCGENNKAPGTICEDNNFCTIGTVCGESSFGEGNGMCGDALQQAGTVCDVDENVCNGIDTCDAGGNCVANISPVCDDGNLCTVDSCDPITGCTTTPVQCNDFNSCDGLDVCNPATGACETGPPVDCDDGNACNGVETCATDPFSGETFCRDGFPVVCVGGSLCDGILTCDPATGNCVNGPPLNCNDNNSCTFDGCIANSCFNLPVPGGSCNDGSACTVSDVCDSGGNCQGTPVVCDDGDACNGSEVCNPATGQCALDAPPVVCDDGNTCNGNEACNPVTGQCEESSPPVVCDDGNTCNGSEVCNPLTGLCVTGISHPDAPACLIGGSYVPIEATPVLIAGAQTNASWMIPVIVSAVGIGIVFARKF